MIVALVGPTATGKSQLALELATSLTSQGRPAEIVNADSMLVYRGMDIGTAKPTAEERGRVRHHLLDILDVTETASVAEFQRLARLAIASCRARGVVPILVGGSALYIRAILDEFDFPGTDPKVRADLESELARLGPGALHARLERLDPEAAATIQSGNGRRIVRALEVITLTGAPFVARLPAPRYHLRDVVQLGLGVDRPTLDVRIAARVDQMWRDGLVGEVRHLVGVGLRRGRTASRALGYRHVLEFLDGECSEDAARAATISATRNFARRQLSWFRRDQRIAWLDAERADLAEAALELMSGVPMPD